MSAHIIDPYSSYVDEESLRIPLPKSLTNLSFEEILTRFFQHSLSSKSVIFDLTKVEWVSLFELLLLIQWIHLLSVSQIRIRVFLPYTSVIHGYDESFPGLLSEKISHTQMYRRQKVSSFLHRIAFDQEIQRLTGVPPISIGSSAEIKPAEPHLIVNEEKKDPFSARILKLKAFSNEEAIDVEGELSNQQLREILKEHSCLDPIDSGMLAEVIIYELASNAIQHGIGKQQGEETRSLPCAWLSARLVKSSRRLLEEVPNWLVPVYRSLLGRHYVEVSICDSGMGIYHALKGHVSQSTAVKSTVKSILDYAFNKFSTSTAKFRTEMETLPRGLFSVYDLVRQYGGVLVLRSSGFYMAYDFLTNRSSPRLLNIEDKSGSCVNIGDTNHSFGGTAIQIILPEAKGLFVKAIPHDYVQRPIKYPVFFEVIPPDYSASNLDEFAKDIAISLERLCRMDEKRPIFVDLTGFDISGAYHLYALARIIRYALYLQNPNILWLLGPRDCELFKLINHYLLTGECRPGDRYPLSEAQLKSAFRDVRPHDRRICPVLMPSGKVLWLGTTENESRFLKNLWEAGEIDVIESGLDENEILHLLRGSSYIISYNRDKYSQSGRLSLRIGNYDCASYLPELLDKAVKNLITGTRGVIHENGSYHLPHGEYSHFYVYLKPLFSQPGIAQKMARYLLAKLSLIYSIKEVDLVVGGTHSAKRLIVALGEELKAETLTVDRYTDQIDETAILSIVSGKKALIVSDIISTGSFVLSMKRKLAEYGCDTIAICSICDLRFLQEEPTNEPDVHLVSLYARPVEKFDLPDREPVFEINKISLSPMMISKEKERHVVPSLMKADSFNDLIVRSGALVPGHIILGPTHYTYFVDTQKLLEEHASDFIEKIFEDLQAELANRKMSVDAISFLVTAEGSNAELYLPDLVKKQIPTIKWVQIDRIRLSKEGIWQLDKIDLSFADVESMKDSIVLILDDGSNTGGTIMQMLQAASEYSPKVIFAYCLVNRLQPIRSSFLSSINSICNCKDVRLKFIANFPIATFVRSTCPICNSPEYDIPKKIKEIEEYAFRQRELGTQYSWNHISAARIRDSVYNLLQTRRLRDLQVFLPHIIAVRSALGIFENRAVVFQEDREELAALLRDTAKLCAVCFVLNRERHLLESIVRFQIPHFEEQIMKTIWDVVQSTSEDILETRDLLDFAATHQPEFVINNLKPFIDRLVLSEEDCVALITKIVGRQDLAEILMYLEQMANEIERLPDNYRQKKLLRGLCTSCLDYYRLRRDLSSLSEIQKAISELKFFYRPSGAKHEGAVEYGTPLSQILKYIKLPKASENIFSSIYRDWRDRTVNCIRSRLAPNIYVIKRILEVELAAQDRSYLFGEDNFERDYLTLEKQLAVLKEPGSFIALDQEAHDLITKISARLYTNLFDSDRSPIAATVKKIPVYIEQHIKERLDNYSEWMRDMGIEVRIDVPEKKINGLMSVLSFNRAIDYIFNNIKEHNFKIKDGGNQTFSEMPGYEIIVRITENADSIQLLIGSNGPVLYDGSEAQGIRMIKQICSACDAEYKIFNEGAWVKNILTVKRWRHAR